MLCCLLCRIHSTFARDGTVRRNGKRENQGNTVSGYMHEFEINTILKTEDRT